jgi:energy-coupling factor transporter transmembrane protein EcfT
MFLPENKKEWLYEVITFGSIGIFIFLGGLCAFFIFKDQYKEAWALLILVGYGLFLMIFIGWDILMAKKPGGYLSK